MDEILPEHKKTRWGFYYYPDTVHYRMVDLKMWLPELKALGASWLTLQAPVERAIPEFFLTGLMTAGVEPILHFHLPLDFSPRGEPLRLLFSNYARWGVQYVALFDKPNHRQSWPASTWAQTDLVERFLDIYIPLASAAMNEGLSLVFPPLQPGGDYWDTAFLRAALRGLQRRKQNQILDNLILGAYGWTGDRPLDWGAGGPESWPATRPYNTPEGSQDQRGFRIFDWYLAIAEAELGATRPLILLAGGSRLGEASPGENAIDVVTHAQRNLAIARMLLDAPAAKTLPKKAEPLDEKQAAPGAAASVTPNQNTQISGAEPDSASSIPEEVLTCNFWLLTAPAGSKHSHEAWYRNDGSTLPVVGALRQLEAARRRNGDGPVAQGILSGRSHPIAHYLLLPLYGWGVAEWQIEAIQPFVQKFHPTVGFSLEEASLASRVTVMGGTPTFPQDQLEKLKDEGRTIEYLNEDGTLIAPEMFSP